MLTNGQDQSAAAQREQLRQALERGREQSRSAGLKLEMNEFLRQQLVDVEHFQAHAKRERQLSQRRAVWNLRYERGPKIEPKEYLASYPVQAQQKQTGLAEGFNNICKRWSLDAFDMAKLLHLEEEIGLSRLILSGQVPPITGDLKDRMALVIGISIGLGELFDDDKDAELQWLNATRSNLGGHSPLKHMLKGNLLNLRDVVDILDDARGLR